MDRNFPTYLYYNNYRPGTKSPGKFIVRTVAPKFVAQVVEQGDSFNIEVLEWWDDDSKKESTLQHVKNWYINKIIRRTGNS
jgi:acetamidase/formamidase